MTSKTLYVSADVNENLCVLWFSSPPADGNYSMLVQPAEGDEYYWFEDEHHATSAGETEPPEESSPEPGLRSVMNLSHAFNWPLRLLVETKPGRHYDPGVHQTQHAYFILSAGLGDRHQAARRINGLKAFAKETFIEKVQVCPEKKISDQIQWQVGVPDELQGDFWCWCQTRGRNEISIPINAEWQVGGPTRGGRLGLDDPSTCPPLRF